MGTLSRPAYISAVMKRAALLLLLAVAVTACSSPATPAPPRVAVWQGESNGLLYLRVIAAEPLRDARLTAPDGRKILTQRLSQPESAPNDSEAGWGRPSVGIGGSGGSSSGMGAGIGLSFPVGSFGGGNRGGGLATQAEFALDAEQMAQYRARPKDWLLELRFDSRIASMAAPALLP